MKLRRPASMPLALSSLASLFLLAPWAASAQPVSQLIGPGWRFRAVADSQHPGVADWHPATIPSEVHTDLQAAGLIPDPFFADNEKRLQWIGEQDWEYRTTLRPEASILACQHIELVFDGLDTFAEVTLNGHPLLKADNMFRAWRADIRPLLHPGDNELRVLFHSPYRVMSLVLAALPYILPGSGYEAYDPAKGIYPVGHYIRTAGYEYGWDWGPKLVTMGIWRPVRIEAWDNVRITNLHIEQTSVTAERALLTAEIDVEAASAGKVTLDLNLSSTAGHLGEGVSVHGGETLDAGLNHLKYSLRIEHPRRWFPAGYGAQDRYRISLELKNEKGAKLLDSAHETIGLRSVELRRQPDSWGVSFAFVVNGIPIFAKGANVIPMDSFPARITPQRERALLTAARDANMNMLRMWGGGYYQTDSFYEIADELGLMVWQEFAFGGGMVPGDKAFQDNVRQEAIEQVKRLRDHPSVVLWCGNNEVETAWDSWDDRLDFKKQIGPDQRERVWQDYIVMFCDILKSVVVQDGGGVPYWPSSPGANFEDRAGNSRNGDMHYWNVWSGGAPIDDYRKVETRFLSEYGFQGMPDLATVRAFAGNEESLTAPALANHERFLHGFDRIQHYLDQETGPARDFASFDYLSQFVQAEAIQTEAEHLRSQMPRAMGSLYWQLNDCWPVASWSSIEFTGRWRALHHAARRFFAPAYVSVHVPGDEIFGTNNYRKSTVRLAHVHTSYDGPRPASGVVRWDLFHLDGRVLLAGRRKVTLRPMKSALVKTIDLAGPIAEFGREQLYLRASLEVGRRRVSESSAFLTLPRFMDLPKPRTKVSVRVKSPRIATIAFTSPVYQHKFEFDVTGQAFSSSDNFFDLYPGQTKEVEVEFMARVTPDMLRKAIRHRSLADTY